MRPFGPMVCLSRKTPLASLCPDPETMAEQLILQLRTMEAEPDYSNICYVKPRLTERTSLG